MRATTRSADLLDDWRQYRNVHYSKRTGFANAVDIEIKKDASAECAQRLIQALMVEKSGKNILKLIDEFEYHLSDLKNHITIEILKNGF